MTDQPEALRLANELGWVPDALADEAAAELRRLHHENERLHQINESHEMNEIQIADLKAVNQELLEALKHAHTWLEAHALVSGDRAQYLGEVIKAQEQK